MTIPDQNDNKDQCTDFDMRWGPLRRRFPIREAVRRDEPRRSTCLRLATASAEANNPTSCSKPILSGTRRQEPIDVSFCETIKKRGIKLRPSNTIYLPLPTTDHYNTWIKPFSAEISPRMQSCASPDCTSR